MNWTVILVIIVIGLVVYFRRKNSVTLTREQADLAMDVIDEKLKDNEEKRQGLIDEASASLVSLNSIICSYRLTPLSWNHAPYNICIHTSLISIIASSYCEVFQATFISLAIFGISKRCLLVVAFLCRKFRIFARMMHPPSQILEISFRFIFHFSASAVFEIRS